MANAAIQTTKTNAPAPAAPKSTALQVKDWMSAPSMQKALAAALAGYMNEATFAAQCYLAAQEPKLAECSPASLFRSFLICAQMGLLPGAHHKHVALVPRGGEVVVQPQWQGFKFLMERQPGIKRVHPVLVHVKDKFAWVDGRPTHEFDVFDDDRVFEHPDTAAKQKRACDLRGGYLVIENDLGETTYHPVSAKKIHKNRLCAETQRVWIAWFEEMCLKTVIRDAWAKRVISIDPQLAQRLGLAEEADNGALGNDPARGSAQLPPPASRTAALTARVTKEIASTASVSDDQLPDSAEKSTADATKEATAQETEATLAAGIAAAAGNEDLRALTTQIAGAFEHDEITRAQFERLDAQWKERSAAIGPEREAGSDDGDESAADSDVEDAAAEQFARVQAERDAAKAKKGAK